MADETTTTRENARKTREGVVTSAGMDKTAVVTVTTRKPHPRYRKTMARSTRLYVHDEENTLRVGDRVRVTQDGQSVELEVARDDRLAEGVVRVSAAHPATAALARQFGAIEVERVR